MKPALAMKAGNIEWNYKFTTCWCLEGCFRRGKQAQRTGASLSGVPGQVRNAEQVRVIFSGRLAGFDDLTAQRG